MTMKTTMKLLAVAALLASACGDNNKGAPDAKVSDGNPADAYCSNCPAAPMLGAQIDRIGRPAVNTVLNHGFDATAAGGTAKDAYNANANPATWIAYTPEFYKNMAILDSLDTLPPTCGTGTGAGKCEIGETNANCPADCPTAAQIGKANGCGNAVLYNGTGSGPPTASPNSYQTLAGLLSNDELFLDTARAQCGLYLAVEFGIATGGTNSTCGGRMPQYDVIDFSLSFLSMGIAGFSTDGMFTPQFKDNAPAHTDYLTTFPYLGTPHP